MDLAFEWRSTMRVQRIWRISMYNIIYSAALQVIVRQGIGEWGRDRQRERGGGVERVQSSSTAVKLFTPLSQISESVKHKGKQIRQLNAIRMSKKIHFIFCFTRQSSKGQSAATFTITRRIYYSLDVDANMQTTLHTYQTSHTHKNTHTLDNNKYNGSSNKYKLTHR